MRRLFLAITVALGAVLVTGGGALADPTGAPTGQAQAAPAAISGEIIFLHATNGGTGIDPKIGKMPALGQPPFSSYNSYTLLDRVQIPLVKGQSQTTKLATGSLLVVTLKDIVEPKKKDDIRRFVIDASIQKPDGRNLLPQLEVNAKAGDPFFVAGENYKGGTLVIGIKVNP